MKKQNFVYIALGGLAAFIFGIIWFFRPDIEDDTTAHMAKMREAKAAKAAKEKADSSETQIENGSTEKTQS